MSVEHFQKFTTEAHPFLSLTTNSCRHLVIDAGHIAIESDLVAKDAIRLIHQKRHQQYTDDDYKNLEALMYDKLSLRLEDAQVCQGTVLHLSILLTTSPVHHR